MAPVKKYKLSIRFFKIINLTDISFFFVSISKTQGYVFQPKKDVHLSITDHGTDHLSVGRLSRRDAHYQAKHPSVSV